MTALANRYEFVLLFDVENGNPTGDPDAGNLPPLSELRRTWEASRRQLERLLNEFPSRQLNQAIYPHPRSGHINIYQLLDFLLDHLLHHQQQIGRITKALRPAA